jgi:hypothetical protein
MEAVTEAPSAVTWVTKELYGGAISCELPASYADVSELRQVPDNQEVFAEIKTDQSIIIELLQREEVSNDKIGEHLFSNLAADNAASDASVVFSETLDQDSVPHLADPIPKSLLVGYQQVAKFKDEEKHGDAAKNRLRVILIVIRLENVTTDLTISINTPVEIAELSSSNEFECLADASGEAGQEISLRILKTLKINDWGLFG